MPERDLSRVRIACKATTAVLINDLLHKDGPYADYADHWLKVGGLAALVHYSAFNPVNTTANS